MELNNKTSLILLFLIPFLLCGYIPKNYKPLADVSFEIVEQFDDSKIYRPTNTIFSGQFISKEVSLIKDSLMDFSKEWRLPEKSCKSLDVDYYVIDSKIINDVKRFPLTLNDISDRWAMYSPYHEKSGYSVIMLANSTYSTSRINSVILAHEYAHYVYDKNCWSDYWSGNTETFAQAFHKYYGLNRFGRIYNAVR